MCNMYPIATQKLDQYGKSPIDVAVQPKNRPMLKMLSRFCPDAFAMTATCHDPIMQLLEQSNVAKRQRGQISGLLRCPPHYPKKKALTANNKKYEEQLELEKQQIASLKEVGEQEKQQITSLKEQLEQEKKQIASLKEQVEHSEKQIQSFEVVRKLKSKLLSRLLETSDDWTLQISNPLPSC
jgi:small-conductance mechanosensitive channel